MKKAYEVFSNHNQPTTVEAVLPGGVKVNAVVDSLEVQLVPKDDKSGTVKLVFTDPAEIEDAKMMFVVGETVDLSFGV